MAWTDKAREASAAARAASAKANLQGSVITRLTATSPAALKAAADAHNAAAGAHKQAAMEASRDKRTLDFNAHVKEMSEHEREAIRHSSAVKQIASDNAHDKQLDAINNMTGAKAKAARYKMVVGSEEEDD